MIPRKVSDEDLLPLLQHEGTAEEAFSILVERYSHHLYTVIRRIVLFHEDANDVLQNTFVKIWRNITTFRGDSKLSTWMYSIATNEALSHLRREHSERKMPITTDMYDLVNTLSGDPYFDGDKAEAELYAAIAQLPEKQKLVFQLRYFEEMSYNEIAQITSTSVGALKASYHHAVKKLEHYLHIEELED